MRCYKLPDQLHPGADPSTEALPWLPVIITMAEESLSEKKKKCLELCNRDNPLLTSQLGGYGWSKSHEHMVQPFHGFLSFLGHNKSPSKPVKRHSTDSVSNDFSCLGSFWCSQHQSRAEGSKTWSCWNPALPRHDIMSARHLRCC